MKSPGVVIWNRHCWGQTLGDLTSCAAKQRGHGSRRNYRSVNAQPADYLQPVPNARAFTAVVLWTKVHIKRLMWSLMLAVTYNQVGFHRTPRAVKRASIWWHRKQFCAGTNHTLPRPATGEPDNEFLQSKLFSPSRTHFPTLLFELYVYAFIHQLLNYQRKLILLWKTWTIKRPKFSPSCHKLLCKTCLWLKKKKKHCPRKACIQIVRKELLSTFYGEIFLEITWAPFALSSHNLPTFAAHCFLSRIVVVTAHESSVT